eukprot:TRINITY_DN15478_c0_g1_i2.p1 TRINITY_DN15478_c0_g1~~TRINITY_DN15478_c0_g1_i2.p1  ORF type:complete len:481 (-),score=86.25 TRINITY_DN15478_c0_g1_i2:437-1879(-)
MARKRGGKGSAQRRRKEKGRTGKKRGGKRHRNADGTKKARGGGGGGGRGGGGGGGGGGKGSRAVRMKLQDNDLQGAVTLFCSNPADCGSALKDVFEAAVKCRALNCLVAWLAQARSTPLHHRCLLEALLAMPIETDPLEGACFAQVCASLAGWDSISHCNYFAQRSRHAVLEFLEETKEVLDKIRGEPPDARVRSGFTLLGVRLRPGMKAGELTVEGNNRSLIEADRRGIVKGDAVGVSAYGWMWPAGLVEADVVNEMPLVIKFCTNVQLPNDPSLVFRVDKLANRQQYSRVIGALHLLSSPDDPSGGKKRVDQRPSVSVRGTVVLPGPDAVRCASGRCFATGAARTQCLENLNESQARALKSATSQSVTLVQGPPGTGKTTCAVKILQQWARVGGGRDGQIMAASDSNIAVDNMIEGLLKLGVNVVRLGRPESARPEMLAVCADEIAPKRACSINFRVLSLQSGWNPWAFRPHLIHVLM